MKEGFKVSDCDSSLFIKSRVIDGRTHWIRMNVHVDDAHAVYSHAGWYREFKDKVTEKFDLSAAEDKDVFLGVTIEDLEDGAVKLCQPRYVEDLCAKFLPEGAKPAKVPYIQSLFPSKSMSPTTQEAIDAMKDVPYRSLIGGLMHIANFSRPDIAAAVNICAQFSANPGPDHWKCALTILKYLKGTPDHGVVYGRKKAAHIPYIPLCGYADSSWADDTDDRKSRTGTMLWSWGGPIEWVSTKQKAIALSSTEAEYMAARDMVKSVVWARRLFQEFGYDDLGCPDHDGPLTEEEMNGAKPTVIWEDNSGCIEWSKNPIDFKKRKHIDIAYKYVDAKVAEGEVKLSYKCTEHQMADLLTKYLASERFIMLRDCMVSDK